MSGDEPTEPDAPSATTPTVEGSESELLAVVDRLSGGAYFAVDENRNIIAFGEGMQEITGLSLDEVLGRHCLNAFRCVDCLKGCGLYSAGEFGPLTLDLFHKDGHKVRVVKSGRLVRDPAGKIVMGVERVWRAADEIDASAAPDGSAQMLFDRMMRVLGRYFVAADEDMRIVRCSQHLAELSGRSHDELHGLPVSELLGEDLFAEGTGFRRALLAGERREGWRAFIDTAEGERLAVSVTAAPLASADVDLSRGCMAQAATLIVIRADRSGAVRAREKEVPSFAGMVARSPAMQDIFRLIGLLHDNDARVLITGESGTGKELVAHAVHQHSLRSDGPFVTVNCGALPGELLESELFGHVRGAFTGAIRDKSGRFELAAGGTIFLDEIGDLPLALQVKLLRVLQDGSFERVGDSRPRRVDVRVIAATNQDLTRAVAEGRFREDLYYRLRVVPIELPPLRERREDLSILVDHLLDKIGRRRERALRLSPSAMRALLAYDWPGNVRQLENALEYATAVCDGQTIHEDDLPDEVLGMQTAVAALSAERTPGGVPGQFQSSDLLPHLSAEELEEAERIRDILEATHYRRQEAADRLGISRWTLWRKMKTYGLK